MQYTNLAPRVGVACQWHQNTVVRAGFGRTYGMGWSGNTFGEILTFSFPTAVQQNLVAPNANYYAFNLSQGPPGYTFPAIPSNGNYPLPNGMHSPTRPLTMRIPTLDAWNMTSSRNSPGPLPCRLAYVGNHGIHNMFDSSNQANPNQPTIGRLQLHCRTRRMSHPSASTRRPVCRTPMMNGARSSTAPPKQIWASSLAHLMDGHKEFVQRQPGDHQLPGIAGTLQKTL